MTASAKAPTRMPTLGAGIGYRREIRNAIFEAHDEIDCLELLVDQFIEYDSDLREVEEVCNAFTVIPHGIGLSIGSAIGVDREYVRRVKRVNEITRAPYYSEHLCMTRAPGIDIGHLSPLLFTEPVLRQTIRNVLEVQELLETPLALENVTYLFEIPGGELSQGEFFRQLVRETDCGVLLDVTNVHINAVNHGFDPVEFLDELPLDRVFHVHLAGGFWSHEVLVDSHSEEVQDESWALLEAVVDRTAVPACIIEHDANFPSSIGPLVEQVRRARQIISAQPADSNSADLMRDAQREEGDRA